MRIGSIASCTRPVHGQQRLPGGRIEHTNQARANRRKLLPIRASAGRDHASMISV